MINYGLLPDLRSAEEKARDYFFGDNLGEGEILAPDSKWDPLPTPEYQNIPDEKFFCVTASATNCCEMIYLKKYGKEINLNDAFTAKLSGTTRQGNSLYNVGQSLHKINGYVYQSEWKANNVPFDEFYAEVPADIQKKGLDNLTYLEIIYKYIPEPYTDAIMLEALKYSPLQITIAAYGTPDANGIYHNVDWMPNHAVELLEMIPAGKGGYYKKIQDHYLGHETRMLAPDYRIGTIYKYNVTKKDMIFMKEKNNPNVYAIIGGKKTLVIDMPALQALGGGSIQEVDSLSGYPDNGTFVWVDHVVN